ncbi:MGDG synthase family glycosyltransferase [Bacillus sp. SD088]|uniref:MGDG synthase family glycosyltransferase n=1 Tax=Bacillus sp. SD088 TaxID=2782012 RepID=UPI001A95663E|nr:galactosyldiacylglycerol synthase [Bacillus sp. SD088]MBO0995905.1 galactosyldiacylglycerol synthase [Bacillus sp. SD088]
MKKILFFPLLTMPSGHHQVAETMISYLQKRNKATLCKKIDLLSAWNPVLESMVTKTYLGWIHFFPKSYAWTYKKMAHSSQTEHDYKKYYDHLFLKKMKAILLREKPDLIICTHAFPSHLLSTLKKDHQLTIPVMNVYTDFFINDVWGIEGIDYHLVSNSAMKQQLLVSNHVSESRVWVTGIPIGEQFSERKNRMHANQQKWKVLISGGSVGLGGILSLLKLASPSGEGKIIYYVLCGKNKRLFQQLQKLDRKNVQPIPYISDKAKMNALYERVDAIITKPGGVTISESLRKGLPIFIHSALPGQEEINLQLLKDRKLILELNPAQPLDTSILSFFQDTSLMAQIQHSIHCYLNEIEVGYPSDIVRLIHYILHPDQKNAIQNTKIAVENPE